VPTPEINRDTQQLGELAAKAGLPTIGGFRESAQRGLLIGYGPIAPPTERGARFVISSFRSSARGCLPPSALGTGTFRKARRCTPDATRSPSDDRSRSASMSVLLRITDSSQASRHAKPRHKLRRDRQNKMCSLSGFRAFRRTATSEDEDQKSQGRQLRRPHLVSNTI
jgi:hypothetical protein